jgi:cyclopropane fatty-acyl-phospholipid synthase-like methyltransferase
MSHERIRTHKTHHGLKNDEKEKTNQACEDHKQIFVAALSANDHTTYDSIVKFGATQHMTFEQDWFTTYECISPRKVFMGDDIVLEAIGKGNIKATTQVGGQLTHTTITQVLHVPKMKNSLIFVSKLIFEGFKMEFNKDGYKVNGARRVIVAEAQRDKNLYLLNVKVHKDTTHIANSSDEDVMLWHERLGHLNMAWMP